MIRRHPARRKTEDAPILPTSVPLSILRRSSPPDPPSRLPLLTSDAGNNRRTAQYVVRHYKDGIQVGFIAHPSFVEEEELAAITGPLSIAAAETDGIFPAEKRHKSEEILLAGGYPYQINLYSGVAHGFTVRCDPSKQIERFTKEQAFYQAVAWFDEFLA